LSYLENFIVIDDDKINNKVCIANLRDAYPDSDITDFTDPVKGFDFIASTYSRPDFERRAILLLDVFMPILDAWGFLEKFDKLDELTKRRIKIYILSSSVDKTDMTRAHTNKYVEYYLIKPLNKESIRPIVHVLHKRLGIQ
jgi:CheY-like chemotaxis protein